jgi:hypothetical protein
VRFDDTFETVRGLREESHSLWKKKCGFTREESKGKYAKNAKGKKTKITTNIQNNEDQIGNNIVGSQGDTSNNPMIQNEGADLSTQLEESAINLE